VVATIARRRWDTRWSVDILVADVDQAAATTVEHGGTVTGTVTVSPHELPRFRSAVIADPHGARLSLSQLWLQVSSLTRTSRECSETVSGGRDRCGRRRRRRRAIVATNGELRLPGNARRLNGRTRSSSPVTQLTGHPLLASEGSARERLLRLLEAVCQTTDDHADLLTGLDAATLNAIYHEEGDDSLTRADFVAPIVRLLRDGALDGSLRTLSDPDEAATVLYAQVSCTYLHLRQEHRWAAQRATRAVTELALQGVEGWRPNDDESEGHP
jgi:hypothetical protein